MFCKVPLPCSLVSSHTCFVASRKRERENVASRALSARVRPFVMLQGARSGASRNRAERGVRPTREVQQFPLDRAILAGCRVQSYFERRGRCTCSALGRVRSSFLGEIFALMFRISASSRLARRPSSADSKFRARACEMKIYYRGGLEY